MSNTALRKRAWVLAPTIVLSMALVTMAAFSASQLITAKKGGKIDVAPGIELIFLPKALEKDTVISANVSVEPDYITYDFEPDGTVLSKSARLIVSRAVLENAEVADLTLYGEGREVIKPKESKKRLIYRLDHFSRYYHRRR